jgi:hypothetical protein
MRKIPFPTTPAGNRSRRSDGLYRRGKGVPDRQMEYGDSKHITLYMLSSIFRVEIESLARYCAVPRGTIIETNP